MARNPDYDITFDCEDYDPSGVVGQGRLLTHVAIAGDWIGIGIVATSLDLGDILIQGSSIFSAVWGGTSLDLEDIFIEGELAISLPVNNWVRWSDIGSFSFLIDRKNVAGEMPLDWPGTIYDVRKLGSSVMVYGSGGITQLVTKDNIFGMKTLTRVGIKGAWAITGTEHFHFFVDSRSRLWKMGDQMELLGYDEFLSLMTTPVLNYDESMNLLYICDGTYGYVYSLGDKSFGTGPTTITGIGYVNGSRYVIGSAAPSIPTFEIVTDILDIGSRNWKTLHELEIGTNLSGNLEAMVDFSNTLQGVFTSVGWKPISPEGVAFIHCAGKEFKVRVRNTTGAAIEVDYLRIKGVIHNYSPIDT